jgi:hypothetical protein
LLFDKHFVLGNVRDDFDGIAVREVERHLIRGTSHPLAAASVQPLHQFLDRLFERLLLLLQLRLRVLHAGAGGQQFLVDFPQTTMGLKQLAQLLLTGFQVVGKGRQFRHAASYSRFPKWRKRGLASRGKKGEKGCRPPEPCAQKKATNVFER